MHNLVTGPYKLVANLSAWKIYTTKFQQWIIYSTEYSWSMTVTYVVLVILHVTVNGSSSWILPGASTTVNFSSGSGGTWTKTMNYKLKTLIYIRTAAFSCPVWILPLSPNFDLQTRSIFPTETWFCCTVDKNGTKSIQNMQQRSSDSYGILQQRIYRSLTKKGLHLTLGLNRARADNRTITIMYY